MFLLNVKYAFIITILTLLREYRMYSFSKYRFSKHEKLICDKLDKEKIRNVYNINKNVFAILLDDDLFSCDKNNNKCNFIETYVKFVITSNQRMALILDDKLELEEIRVVLISTNVS